MENQSLPIYQTITCKYLNFTVTVKICTNVILINYHIKYSSHIVDIVTNR